MKYRMVITFLNSMGGFSKSVHVNTWDYCTQLLAGLSPDARDKVIEVQIKLA